VLLGQAFIGLRARQRLSRLVQKVDSKLEAMDAFFAGKVDGQASKRKPKKNLKQKQGLDIKLGR